MPIVITIISIILITAIVWLLNKALPLRVCPICAGVSLTWLWILVGIFSNQLPATSYLLPAAILMGGSVVGIAYQLDKRIPANSKKWRNQLLWKAIFIPLGFAAVYSLLLFSWFIFGGLVLAMIIAAALFLKPEKAKTQGDISVRVEKIEKQMENCC